MKGMEEMELVKKKEACCGCRTCEKVCPKQAITMVEDACGFLYPQIDESKCVNCGLCLQKCAFQSGYKTRKEFEPFYGYGARHKLEKIYMRSRSGGAFVAISSHIIDQKGAIYGAGYSKDKGFHRVIHKRATTKRSRNEFCGSKYVQSDLKGTFLSIKKDLENGKLVLFSGTGCQVGALHTYLGKEYDNLYTIDIVCHGAPSPKIWDDFLTMREKEYGQPIKSVMFRNKRKYGWTDHRETVRFENRRVSSRIYSKLFSQGVLFRPSCYECVYANTNRPGDITIADFWGHEDVDVLADKWNDDKGISLVLINNKHGMKIWEESRDQMDWVDCTGYPFRHQNMKRSTTKSERYEEFWEDYIQHGFEYCAEKYVKYRVKRPIVVSEENMEQTPSASSSDIEGDILEHEMDDENDVIQEELENVNAENDIIQEETKNGNAENDHIQQETENELSENSKVANRFRKKIGGLFKKKSGRK